MVTNLSVNIIIITFVNHLKTIILKVTVRISFWVCEVLGESTKD